MEQGARTQEKQGHFCSWFLLLVLLVLLELLLFPRPRSRNYAITVSVLGDTTISTTTC